MHEIVTLQFGQRANYLATHFWNIQESYFTYAPNTEPSIVDHDIHFRPGIGTDGSDTYTPRTIIYDLKGGFGTLKQRNALYDDTSDPSSRPGIWNDSGVSTINQQPIQQIPYQRDLDAGLPTSQLRADQIRYWSDFNRVFFHPRSIVQLNEYSLNSQLTPFDNWSAGEELWRDVDREADLLDRDVRLFVEECDSMQGFHVFTGTDDAWGGWTERYLDALRDEFGKKSIWVWGVEDTRQAQREQAIARKANAAKSLAGISKLVSGYTRLGSVPETLPEYVRLDSGSEWETSALMAAAVESVTLPTRLRSGAGRGSSMPQFEQTLDTNEGQNVWELGLSLNTSSAAQRPTGPRDGNGYHKTPAGHAKNEAGEDDTATFDIKSTPSSTSLLPKPLDSANRGRRQRHVFGQIEASRHPKKHSNGRVSSQPLDREERMRRRYDEEAIVERFLVPLGFPRLDAYPAKLFVPSEDVGNEELSLSTGFTTSTTTKQNIFELRDLVTRYNRVVALDEREELYNTLTETAEKYVLGWESDDSGDDE